MGEVLMQEVKGGKEKKREVLVKKLIQIGGEKMDKYGDRIREKNQHTVNKPLMVKPETREDLFKLDGEVLQILVEEASRDLSEVLSAEEYFELAKSLVGSDPLKDILKGAIGLLRERSVPYESNVASALKQLEGAYEMATWKYRDEEGEEVYSGDSYQRLQILRAAQAGARLSVGGDEKENKEKNAKSIEDIADACNIHAASIPYRTFANKKILDLAIGGMPPKKPRE